MKIIHDSQNHKFITETEGCTAYVSYNLENGELDIRHTIVPPPIGGRGIAAQLVKMAYDYALQHDLKCVATCSYAVAWLQRHPEYHGKISKEYGGHGSCAF